MIETSMLGDAVGVQYQGVVDKSESTNLPALSNGVIVGRFKRGIIGRVFTVTSDTYRTLLGHNPSNPSYMAVTDLFNSGVSEVSVFLIGATGKVTAPPIVPDNKAARVIISGAFKVGETLTATVSDANGVPNDIVYQWFADGAPISGETAKTYALKAAQVGKAITVKATFTDNDGYAESATSAASEAVQPAMPVVDVTVNNIGVQGAANFGIGITDTLPVGMSEMEGTTTLGHKNYGNYQYSDGSIMCWIPLFYYRWGGIDSPYAAKYGFNSCDVKSKYDFADVAAANAAGYALHRAFYDDGQIKDGFFVDKYQTSNNGGIASSIKNGIPLTAFLTFSPFSALNNAPKNTLSGGVDVAKSRSPEFFATTLFIQRALSLLSMAHGQASTSAVNCAWYDATGSANYPRGCNNGALGDAHDTTVKYTASGYAKQGLTGSATNLSKTTHNGQANGVADLNGNMSEVALGVTRQTGIFYVLKTTTKASTLTSGGTLSTDVWGTLGVKNNYDSLGSKFAALTGVSLKSYHGNGSNQVFSSALFGLDWQASCAGIPHKTGIDIIGTNAFGRNLFYDSNLNGMCATVGGNYNDSGGVWTSDFYSARIDGSNYFSVRAALYNV